MELDELKILIKEKPAMQGSLKSPGEFAALLSKKTQSITAKLKRSLWIELIACIVFTIMLLLAGIIGKYSSLRIYFSVFAILPSSYH